MRREPFGLEGNTLVYVRHGVGSDDAPAPAANRDGSAQVGTGTPSRGDGLSAGYNGAMLKRGADRERILPLLDEAGGVTEDSVRRISAETGVPEADIWATGLFYS